MQFIDKRAFLATTLISICLICNTAMAQREAFQAKIKEMHVDMPDEVDEPGIIEKHQWQVETAIQLVDFETGKNALIGEALVRFGISRHFELRMLVEDGRNRDRYAEETVQAVYPLSLGAKVSLLEGNGLIPAIAAVAWVEIPATAHSELQRKYWSPTFLLAFENKAGEHWKLEYNIGAGQEPFGKKWSWQAAASLHYKVTDPVEVFTEYFAQYANGTAPENNIGAGIAWQPGNSFEVYLSGGSTVGYSERSSFLKTGLAFRFN